MGRNTGDIINYCDSHGNRVISSSSADDYANGVNNGTIKPGDVIMFYSGGADVHTAIASNGVNILHAWSERTGTCEKSFIDVWN